MKAKEYNNLTSSPSRSLARWPLVPVAPPPHTKTLTSAELNRRTVERRAVDAVIWGLPLVGEDA